MLLSTPERGHVLALSPLVALAYVGLGVLTAIASGLFGIGGAIVVVPILVSVFAIDDLVAKGIALLVSIPTSVVGTVSNRHGNAVDVRAGRVLGVTAAVCSGPAVALAVAIPARVSGISFAILLIAIAGQLAVKALRTGREGQA